MLFTTAIKSLTIYTTHRYATPGKGTGYIAAHTYSVRPTMRQQSPADPMKGSEHKPIGYVPLSVSAVLHLL